MTADGSSAKEHLLRSASAESANLRSELDSAVRTKESAIQENRRLLDDLASCALDCRCARNELEVSKRQIEDLKRQLQHYVSEVKRFEDLITSKEVERNELLDQFRSLSQEASVLENSNHTLENEATQSKVQLSVTLDHVADLETKLTGQDDIINGYENKISDLTSQVANLESQLGHYRQQQERSEADLVGVRDLCMKLDKQKDNLVRELNEKDEQKSQVDRDIVRIRRESATLQNSLSKDRTSIENLEKLLADARQETVQQRLYNEELEAEIQTLKERIEDLQTKVSPATATFVYSANLGAAYEHKCCTCCANCQGCSKNKGDVIDTAAVVHSSEKKNCCGECSGQLQCHKRQIEITETKTAMWKAYQDRKLPLAKSEEKNQMSAGERFQKSIGGSFNNQSREGPYMGSKLEEKLSTQASAKKPNLSYGSTSMSEQYQNSHITTPYKSASTLSPHSVSDSFKPNSKSFKGDDFTCVQDCQCRIQKHQQLGNNTNGTDNRFCPSYIASKGHEMDKTNVKCACTSSLLTRPTYTALYSFSKSSTK